MKSVLSAAFACILSFSFLSPAFAAEGPQSTLDAIAKLRAERTADARKAGKGVDYAALNAEVLAQAKAGVEGIDPAKVGLAEGQAWVDLFMQAQDYRGARTVAERIAAGTTSSAKFNAQISLVSADSRLKDYRHLAATLLDAKPVDVAGRIRVASLSSGYMPYIMEEAGKETAMKVLAAGEAALPKDGFSGDAQRNQATRAGDELAKTRKLIEDNPGKETEALQSARRTALTQAIARLSGGTNATAAATAAREAREAQFAKLTGTPAPELKPTHTLGEVKSIADLKGKVVMLDFFAHWCGPCIASFPSVRSLYDDLKPKGLQVIGVTRFQGYYKTENRAQRDMPPAKELEQMKTFLAEKNMNWPVAFVDKPVFEAYACSAIPHVVLIDKTGKIRQIKVGYNAKETDAFRAQVEKLLDEP